MSENKKDKDPNHQYSRGVVFKNYDYAGPENGDETSPGTGLYGDMSKHKSVSEFLEKARNRSKHLVQARVNLFNKILKLL